MSEPLTPDELSYLAVLVTQKRRKKEHERTKFKAKPGQDVDEYAAFTEHYDRQLEWVRDLEDHLILLIGEIHPKHLRGHHRERLADLTKDARRCPRCDSPAPHLHPATQYEGEAMPCPHPWHEHATICRPKVSTA